MQNKNKKKKLEKHTDISEMVIINFYKVVKSVMLTKFFFSFEERYFTGPPLCKFDINFNSILQHRHKNFETCMLLTFQLAFLFYPIFSRDFQFISAWQIK